MKFPRLILIIPLLLSGCHTSSSEKGLSGSGILYQSDAEKVIKTYFLNTDNDTFTLSISSLSDYSDISEPVWSESIGEFYFSITDNGIDDILSCNRELSDLQNLTNTPDIYETNPVPSPNGDYIAFERFETKPEIWIMDNNGNNLKNLTKDIPSSSSPLWDKDNRHIYFSSLKEGTPNIFRLDVLNGDLENLSKGKGLDGSFTTSTDSQILAFDSDRNGLMDIFTLNLESGEVKNVTNSKFREVVPVISPNGKKIVYQSDANGGWDLYLIDLPSGYINRLTQNPEENKANIVWNEYSTQIYFNMDTNGFQDIYEIDIGSGNINNLTNTPDINEFAPKIVNFGE